MSPSPTNPFRRFLDRLTARSPIGEEEQQALLSLPGHPVQVGANRDIIRLGERVDHTCLVVEGLIGRFGRTREGHRQITAVHIAGDMVDLESVVVPDAGSALQALTVTTVVKVPHSALREVALAHPAVAEAFWRECVVERAILTEWVLNVGRRSARASLAHLLCEMACRFDAVEGNRGSFHFPVTQNQLADMLALTPVHVNRVLQSLRQEKLIETAHRTVSILNWTALAEVGEFDAAYLQIGTSANDNLIYAPAGVAAE